jgi:hypothetical protein
MASDPAQIAATCETCRWRTDRPHCNPDRETADFPAIMYACKRRAPVATGGLHCPSMTIWPTVSKDNFCGEHQPKEPTDGE